MKKRLLNKTLRTYLIASILVLTISAPAFFYLTRYIQIEEAEEMLYLRKHEFEKIYIHQLTSSKIAEWNRWNFDTKIERQSIEKTVISDDYFKNTMDGDMEPYKVLKTPVIIEGEKYTFLTRISMLDSEDTLYNVMLIYLTVILLLLVIMYLITKYYSKRLWKPFQELLEQLESFDLSKPGVINYPKTEIDEFARMNTVIGRLIDRNLSVFNAQKEFVENAAHELQTPLAIMRAKLDNLAQGDLTQNDAASIEALNHSLERLTHLNRNILLLSRMEHDYYSSEENVSVNDMLQHQFEFLAEQLAYSNIQLTLNFKEVNYLKANKSLLEICLSNLLTNAIKHNNKSGTVSVIVDSNSVRIANTGNPEALDATKLYNRFSKNSHNKGSGTGLGLSIVSRIVEINNWRIHYVFENYLHTFIINF